MAEKYAASAATARTRREWRRVFTVVCAVLALSYGYFFSGGGWNQASRFALVRAIVEQKTIQIDRYHHVTGDKAQRDGHYYCDKAPGVSFIAVPVVAAARPILKMVGVDAQSQAGLTWLAFLATFFASSMPSVGGAAASMWLARRLGAEPWHAALAALTVGLGTPTFAYSILFWGHATAGACLIAALALGVAAVETQELRGRLLRSTVTGLLLASAALVEYPAAGAGSIVGAALIYLAHRARGMRGAAELLVGFALGALVPAALLLTYQKLAFGSAFTLSYAKVQGFEGMKQGFFGISFPRPEILWKLIQGSRRGLIWLAPCLLVVPMGFYLLLRRTRSLTSAIIVRVALAVFAFYMLLNASYHYWDGGFTYGPRHVGPALPFLGLGIAAACSGPGALRRATISLAVLSIFLTTAAMAVNPMPPADVKSLHTTLYLPGLLSGKLAQNGYDYFGLGATHNFNLGERMGLEGAKTLLPLLMTWALGLTWLRRLRARIPLLPCTLSGANPEYVVTCSRCSRRCSEAEAPQSERGVDDFAVRA
ncbi:MAG: hypothetical protein ACOY0T_33675 [Myxococcota bacterium]